MLLSLLACVPVYYPELGSGGLTWTPESGTIGGTSPIADTADTGDTASPTDSASTSETLLVPLAPGDEPLCSDGEPGVVSLTLVNQTGGEIAIYTVSDDCTRDLSATLAAGKTADIIGSPGSAFVVRSVSSGQDIYAILTGTDAATLVLK